MSSKLRFAGVTFSVPMSWIGTALQGTAKKQFDALKQKIDVYNVNEISSDRILIILDMIERIKEGGYSRSVPVLNEIVHYLRVSLLSSETELVYHTLVLLDYIVKNSGFIMHIMIGRRKFMKTISWVARKHTAESSHASRRVGEMALDCVQAWGEAFYPREEFYPHIYGTYKKLRYKYKMRFPRPDFDPSRVPIFLGEISYSEKTMANTYNNDLELNYGSLEETKEEPRTVRRESLRAPSRPIPPIKPPRGYVSSPEIAVVDVPCRDEKDLIDFEAVSLEQSDFFFSSQQQQRAYSDSDFGTLDVSAENYYQLPPPLPLPLPSTAPSAPSLPSAPPDSKASATDRVMALYKDSLLATTPALLALPPSAPSALEPVPSLVPKQSIQPERTFSPASHHAMTPWDVPVSSTVHIGARQHSSQVLIRSHSLTSPPRTVGSTVGNASWDLDGALDLARLADSLPARKEKPAVPSQTAMRNKEAEPTTARNASSRPARSLFLPPEADTPEEVVAKALADFNVKMTDAQSQRASPQQHKKQQSRPPLPSVPPPAAVPPSVPPDVPLSVSSAVPPLLPPAVLADLPEPPPVPPPPPPSPMTIVDASLNCASYGLLPDWLDSSPVCTPTPPPIPNTTPPPPPLPAPLNPLEGSAHSSDDDPILTLIQNMNNPDTVAQPGVASGAYIGASNIVPRLQPPAPGPTRLIKPSPRRPSEALLEMTFNEKIQQQRAKLAHVDAPIAATATPADKANTSNPFEEVVLTPFDPTAGPRPVPLPRRPEPRKVSFTAPSSDPNNQIKYYGNQRVVLRKAI